MNFSICTICKKPRGGGSHQSCSKILQEASKQRKPRKGKLTKYTRPWPETKITKFLNTGDYS